MRLGKIVAPKLHRTRTKRFTPTYLCDNPSRARCGKLAPWHFGNLAIHHTLSFSFAREKGSIAFTVSLTPIVFRLSSFIFRSFRKAFLLVEPARCLGREAGCMQHFMLRPVYSSLSRRTAGIGS